ncbi:unnamed protein product [Symbiodinium natans]|uniref:Uncharacterized protein n=1 Tax=Symbiodinium natans TaxID=878477 RepID=A0A812JWH4_9DINO|nr:unnamed protein product [Symbiodinium natans]
MVKRTVVDVERDSLPCEGQKTDNTDQEMLIPTSPATPPELRTPSEFQDSDTEMLPEDDVVWLMSSPVWITPDDDDDEILTDARDPDKMKELPTSAASTAPPSPALTALCASATAPVPNRDAAWQLQREKELSALSREELREELGLDGTDIAQSWSQHDLLITLVEIEKVIPDMSRLVI